MNGLSWFIYLSNIVNTISSWASVLSVFIGIIYFIFMVVMSCLLIEPTARRNDKDLKDIIEIKTFRSSISWLVMPILVVCIPLALLVPDRQTMLLIAGSEMGQRVVQSEQVKGIVDPGLDLVKSWIAEETAKLKGKKKD